MKGNDIETPDEFARALNALRRASDKSYRRLADECGLGFNTIAGYCSGRHLPQLAVRAEFAALLTALGVPPGGPQKVWLDALRELPLRAGRSAAPVWNPYRGLEAFQPGDAEVFFGRSALTAQLLDRLGACHERGMPLAVVGPSGSGKSSLLRAGLLPLVGPSTLLTPGAAPMRQWAAHVAQAAADAVVLVDQFEEVFTLCADESERTAFLDVLLECPGPVVFGMRADFYGRALRYPRLAAVLEQGQVPVGPMTEAQLREVIVEPARLAGLVLEDGLVDVLLADAGREPGALPLLSYTLKAITELAAQESRKTAVGVRHYRAAGGVRGAVGQTAEAAFRSLPSHQQAVCRRLFLRLVHTDDGTADIRRRVTSDELLDTPSTGYADDVAEVLDVFVTHRLLTAGDQTVEFVHEALLMAWPRLTGWLADNREGRRVHGRLRTAARQWRAERYPAEGLYQGRILATALEWAAEPGSDEVVNALERAFLTASSEATTAREAAARRRVRHRHQLIGLLAALVLIAAAAGVYARQVGDSAHREARTALSRQIAEKADRLRDKDPGLAAQLALAAYAVSSTPEARASLLDSSARPVARRLRAGTGAGAVMATAPSLTAVATSTGRVRVWRTRDGGAPSAVRSELTLVDVPQALALSANGALLAAGGRTGGVSLWRVADGARLPLPGAADRHGPGLALSADGRLLAAGGDDGTVRLWRTSSASAPVVLTGPRAVVRSVAFSPDGHTLAVGGDDATVRLWDVSTPGRPRRLPALTGATSRVYALAISPDGHTLAAGTAAEHTVRTWDISDPRHPKALGKPLTGPASWINAVAFSPDGATLAAASSDTMVWQWDTRSRQSTGTLPQPAPVAAVSYADDNTLTTLAGDGVLRFWTVPGPVVATGASQVFSVSFDATGHRLLTGDGDGSLRLFDVRDPQRPAGTGPPLRNSPGTGSTALAGASVLAHDARTAIGGTTDGSIRLYDLTRPAHPSPAGPPVSVAGATIEAIALDPRGSTAAVSSDDGTVRLLDVSVPSRPVARATLTGPAGIAFGVRFSPDGKLLAAAGEDGVGYVWDVHDLRRPRLLTTVRGFSGSVYATSFSPDGKLLAFGGADYSVRLVDLSHPDGPAAVGTPLIGPVGEIYELAFAPDDNRLAVSSIDHTVWLWDLNRPRDPDLLATLKASDAGLLTVAFAPDGRTLAAAGRGDTVRLWNTDPDTVARWLCGAVGDPITRAEWAQFVPDLAYDPPCP
ncbi:helix-turn-helix domain-containing protein [Streptomyces sp. NPDC047803]|uniref:nSTAND1 domain-containing NTPase n=1 Tax=Streptomyces sp. NPDC047803 TaxID=3160976 RepID=UPI0033C7F107